MDKPSDTNLKKKDRKWIFAIIAAVIIVASGFVVYFELDHHKQQTLYIMVDSGSSTQSYLTNVASAFEKANPGVKVEITTEGYSSLLSAEQTDLKGKSSSPSIMMYYASQAPTLAPYLYNIPMNSNGANNELNSSVMIKGEMYSGGYDIATNGTIMKTIGMPVHTVVGYMLVYQKSIFDNSSIQTGFEKEYHFSIVPSTYKNYTALNDAARYISLNTKFNGTSNNYALLFPDSSHHSIIDASYNILYSYLEGNTSTGVPANSSANYWSFFGMSSSGQISVAFNNSAAVRAMTMYKNLTDFEPAITTEPIGYSEQETYFETGDYAMGLAWSSFFPDFSNSSSLSNNLGIAMLPGNYTGYSPTFLGVNPYSNTTLAMKFLNFASSTNEEKMGINDFSYLPGTENGLKYAENMSKFSWLGSFINYSKNVTIEPKYAALLSALSPLFPTLIPDFNSEIYDYFTGTTSASIALSTAASEWNKTISEQDIIL